MGWVWSAKFGNKMSLWKKAEGYMKNTNLKSTKTKT
jgi:hypothetical protein